MEAAFRPARPDDSPAVARLRAALCEEDGLGPFDEPRTLTALGRLVGDPEAGEVWVATAGAAPGPGPEGGGGGPVGRDPIVAYLVLCWGYSLEFGGRDAFVDELYAIPGVRGQGIGTRLLDLAEDRCRARGVTALHLEVERANTRAQDLYRRHGYFDHSRYLMTKRLGPDR